MPKLLKKLCWYFVLLLKRWSKVFNEGLSLSFNKWCASSKWADQVIYCCAMAFVTASFIHFTLTKDWFKIWWWLNYSWILYYPLGSLWSVLPMFASFYSPCLNKHVVTVLQWLHIFLLQQLSLMCLTAVWRSPTSFSWPTASCVRPASKTNKQTNKRITKLGSIQIADLIIGRQNEWWVMRF